MYIQGKDLNISVISNITIEHFFGIHINSLFDTPSDINYIPSNVCFESNQIEVIQKSDLILVWLNIRKLSPGILSNIGCKDVLQIVYKDILEYIKVIYLKLRNEVNSKIIWMGFEDYFDCLHEVVGSILHNYNFIDRLNQEIKDLLSKTSDVVIDLKRLISYIGTRDAYDTKGLYRWNSPYTSDLIYLAAKEIFKQFRILKRNENKCIVLDCDNVLWGGILSEDGIENISLASNGQGQFFQDFQRFLLTLHTLGIILTVSSKNDLSDVLKVFNSHSEMILREEHIASFQVNWNNKAEQIQLIAEVLNISLDSIVFIDDSIFEVESVNSILPDVKAVLFKKETIYRSLSLFNLSLDFDANLIAIRDNTYQSNVHRRVLKDKTTSYEEYLKALDTKINIHIADDLEYYRISELSQRANKCTIGKRYMVSEIKEKISTNVYELYAVDVSDKFSDLGLVGAFGIIQQSGIYYLDLFCLSCRVLGRNIENQLISYLKTNFKDIKVESCIRTQKNDGFIDLLLLYLN